MSLYIMTGTSLFSYEPPVMLDLFSLVSGTPLSDYILHYEPVHYDRETFQASHHRAKRSTRHDLHLDFTAQGKWVHTVQYFSVMFVVNTTHGWNLFSKIFA